MKVTFIKLQRQRWLADPTKDAKSSRIGASARGWSKKVDERGTLPVVASSAFGAIAGGVSKIMTLP
eukprot:CAMPEP_0173465616 /NCGR_PEP_ID=MMETSP1357-20121228/71962_1 /TAXON_ID=77926 /ORGANISM="Hemiselmis rufescens, Strain PCC563" /LENGTH=65 /DNA_ID=CAMNT_0014433609 /DNA_START=268 /DNA_END=462 /DNA_ORIENTATION=+